MNIDEGSFKYVLARVRENGGQRKKLVVWGSRRSAYHQDAFDTIAQALVGRLLAACKMACNSC